MNELIKSKEDLICYLTSKQIASKKPPESVMVTTKIRREVLTDEYQGKFIHNGTVKRFSFKSIGGGVYEARIEKLTPPEE